MMPGRSSDKREAPELQRADGGQKRPHMAGRHHGVVRLDRRHPLEDVAREADAAVDGEEAHHAEHADAAVPADATARGTRGLHATGRCPARRCGPVRADAVAMLLLLLLLHRGGRLLLERARASGRRRARRVNRGAALLT